jgi:hypothetical protein
VIGALASNDDAPASDATASVPVNVVALASESVVDMEGVAGDEGVCGDPHAVSENSNKPAKFSLKIGAVCIYFFSEA